MNKTETCFLKKEDSSVSKHFSKRNTFLAFLAVILWALCPAVVHEISSLPIFEVISFTLFFSFFFSFVTLTPLKKSKLYLPKDKKSLWIATPLIFCNHFGYCYAFHFIPPSEVELIYYLWPLVFTALLIRAKLLSLHYLHIFALLISIYAIYLCSEAGFSSLSTKMLSGMLLAFLASISWAWYNLYFKKDKRSLPPFQMSFYSGVAAIPSFICHLVSSENFVLPTLSQWGILLGLGFISLNLSQMMWQKGVTKGNILLVSNFPFFVPILSILFLTLFSKAELSLNLLLAASLVTLSSVLLTIPKEEVIPMVRTSAKDNP